MTPAQLKALDFVRDRITEAGFSPTFKEIAEHCGNTPTAAFLLVERLVENGYLRRDGKKHRALALADRPDARLLSTDAIQSELARRGLTLEALESGTRRVFAKGAVTCAADTCFNEVTPGRLFCLTHWRRLPHQLQQDILTAHRRRDRERYQVFVSQARDIADGCGGVL
jgi:SOS-response transcriptional repressor LexA